LEKPGRLWFEVKWRIAATSVVVGTTFRGVIPLRPTGHLKLVA
jgi:hypothetical protein